MHHLKFRLVRTENRVIDYAPPDMSSRFHKIMNSKPPSAKMTDFGHMQCIMHAESKMLPVKEHSDMLAKQFLLSEINPATACTKMSSSEVPLK